MFGDVFPESCLLCGPGFADVDPVIAELSDPDSVCGKVGQRCENPVGGGFYTERRCDLCVH